MSPVLEWLNRLSGVWWEGMVHSSWQAAVVGAAVLLAVQWVGRRWPAPLRYALLVLALLKFACPPLLPVPTGLFSHFAAPEVFLPGPPERKPPPAPEFRVAPASSGFGAGGLAVWAQMRTMWGNSPLGLVSWTVWLMALHLAGTTLIGVSTTRQALRLRRLARASRLRLEPEAGEQYRNLAIALGVYRIPPVAVSEEVHAPMAFGFKAASIMLPPRILAHLNAEELRAVLAHELAHCQRGDLWLNWIQLMLLAVWWFHPVAWMVHRSLRDVREDCCDDLLLARGVVDNDSYCDVLLRAARELCPGSTPNTALALTRPIHPLARRLARITDWDLQRHERISLAGAVIVLLAAVVLFPGVRSRNVPPEIEAGGTTPGSTAVQAQIVVPASAVAPVPVASEPVIERVRTSMRRGQSTGAPGVTPRKWQVAMRAGAEVRTYGTAGALDRRVSNRRLGTGVVIPGQVSQGPNRTPRSGTRAVVRLGPYLVPPVPGHAWTENQAPSLAAWGVVDRRM